MGKFYNIEWVSPPSDTPDKHGNHWYTVKIEGRNIRTLAKNPPTEGNVYGEITKETAQSGKTYYRLRRQQIPEGVSPPSPSNRPGQVAGVAAEASEMLTLLRDNNRLLKMMAGEVEERGDDSAKDEVTYDDDEPVDLSDIPF